MKWKIVRFENSNPEGATFGVFFIDDIPRFTTLELPWKENAHNISCIPEGAYTCKEVTDIKTTGGLLISRTFQVQDVPNRDGILIHVGNSTKDTHGCILIGDGYSGIGWEGITNSRDAFRAFMALTSEETEATLEIVKCSA